MAGAGADLNILYMNTKRIIVSNELRSYAEAVSLALRMLCPGADVFEVEHRYLTREVRRLRPDLVVCSRATKAVRASVASWVELYPDCGSSSTVCVDGACSTIDNPELSDLLEIVRGPLRSANPGSEPALGVPPCGSRAPFRPGKSTAGADRRGVIGRAGR